MRLSLALAAAAASALQTVSAASAEDWKTRSIYQIVTDRFSPSTESQRRTDPIPDVCDPALQTWCGGTWRSIIDKLDYIQGMGFDAIWISPVSQNIDRLTAYNYAYHGYWVNNPTKLNPRFGEESDLEALITAVHKRNMYIMIDVAVNAIPGFGVDDALSSEVLADDNSLWQDPEYFHPQCWIDYNNQTSVENCWMGDEKLPLMDVNTENDHVVSTLTQWIGEFVKKYNVDGLRIDAAKHIPGQFWTGFCGSAGIFCIGEVYGELADVEFAASFQSEGWMDSVLGFALYDGVKEAFSQTNLVQNMSHFINSVQDSISHYPHPEYIGNFIENHDLPRFRNITADPRLALNALVAQFLFDGIPIVYHGQEQDTAFGNKDPYNRAAQWEMETGGYENTTTSQTMTRLNKVRSKMISVGMGYNGVSYMDSRSEIIAYSDNDVAIRKGPIIMMLTNRGSPPQVASFSVDSSGWPRNEAIIDILSCTEFATGAGGSVSVSYSKEGYGGLPYVFMLVSDARQLGVCSDDQMGILSAADLTAADAATRRAPLAIGTVLAAAAAALAALSFL